MDERKLKAYIGFALRARKLVLGVNAVEATRGKVYLMLSDRTASENTKKEIQKLEKRFSCPLVEVDDLESLTGKAHCKLAAMRDESLAGAVLAAIGKDQSQGGDR